MLTATLHMLIAGVAWGVYSLRGARGGDPLRATTWNFLAATPLALLAILVQAQPSHLSGAGFTTAALSGGCASGLGYTVWYHVLPRLSGMLAATAQLAVPLLAALGGSVLLGEQPDARFAQSSALILGGVACVIVAHRDRRPLT